VGRKRKNRIYFDQEVEDAIVEYNHETNPLIRNKLYEDKIAYALDKLCENIINTFKFSYFDCGFDDVKQEVLSFLLLNLHKYDQSKGFKAFSYFSVVAKNYLILVNNGNYKKMKLHSDLTATRTLRELSEKSYRLDTGSYAYDFMNEIITYFEDNIAIIFKKKRDIDIAYSIIELLKRRDDLDNFNKKSLYLLIREMTGVNTTYITKVVNEMKRHYKLISDTFSATGTTQLPPTPKSFF
jgi:hypothetical protein